MVEFSELNDETKMKVCREVAFIIKDLALMYNLCNEGSPQIQMEFLGYKTEQDEKKVWNAKPSTFEYFNRMQRAPNKKIRLYPITDNITQKAKAMAMAQRQLHEDDEAHPDE